MDMDIDMEQINEIISRHTGCPYMLLAALQEIQDCAGYIPASVNKPLAASLGIPEGEVQAVISFYSDLRTRPQGAHHLRVCQGDSCAALGSRNIARAVEQHLGIGDAGEADGRVTYDTVYCLGNCALSPSVDLDGEVYGRVTPQEIVQRLREVTR